MPLGRGLAALIISSGGGSKHNPKESNSEGKIWHIPINAIKPNPHQPRQDFNAEELQGLADSIKEHGILQPLLLTEKADGGYELVAGERRLRAAQMAGLATVPAIIKRLADQQKLEVALIENIQRADLNPLEEAFAYKRLIDEFGLTHPAVAQRVGKSRPSVSNAMRLLDLPEEVKKALVDKKISMGQARALLGLDSKEQQLDMLSSMLGQKITVRDVERFVSKQNISTGKLRRDPNLIYLEDQLRSALGAKVTITRKGEKGTIVISYYSRDELGRLVKKLTE